MTIEFTRDIIDDIKQANFFYGGEDFVLTPEEFEALKHGKILNFGVCGDEYGIIIRLSPELIEKKED